MKFLMDHDVFAVTTRLLRELGHDVVTAVELRLHQAADVMLLQVAHEQQRILITRDRDYGSLVFLSDEPSGVLYLRMIPAQVDLVHDELIRVIGLYSEAILQTVFCVVEPGRHRIRRN